MAASQSGRGEAASDPDSTTRSHRLGPSAALVAALAIAVAACLPAAVRPTPPPTPTPRPARRPPPPTPDAGTAHAHARSDVQALQGRAWRHADPGRAPVQDRHAGLVLLEPREVPDAGPGVGRATSRTGSRCGWVLQVMPGKKYVAPDDDGETGIEVTPTPDDEELEDSPPPSGSPAT